MCVLEILHMSVRSLLCVGTTSYVGVVIDVCDQSLTYLRSLQCAYSPCHVCEVLGVCVCVEGGVLGSLFLAQRGFLERFTHLAVGWPCTMLRQQFILCYRGRRGGV